MEAIVTANIKFPGIKFMLVLFVFWFKGEKDNHRQCIHFQEFKLFI